MQHFTMNISCQEALAYFTEDYVRIRQDEAGKVFLKPSKFPIVGETAKVSKKYGNCKKFGISSDSISAYTYYSMIPSKNGWYQLVEINFDDIIYGETAFISSHPGYDNEEKHKKINVSAVATKEIFENYTHVERVNVGSRVHFILRNSKVNKNTTKICNKSGGSTFNMVNKTLQKGHYYIMERNGNRVSFKKTTKKFVKENKGNIAYCSVSR